jgi:hypothetical protein
VVWLTPLLLAVLPTVIAPRNRDACSLICRAVSASGWSGGWALLLYALWAVGLATAALLALRVAIRVQHGELERRTLTASWSVSLGDVDRVLSASRRSAVPGGGAVRYLILIRGDDTVITSLRDAAARWRPAELQDLIRSAGLDIHHDHRTYGRDEFGWLFGPGSIVRDGPEQ